jgi:8-oxo-dGTP pyrophosphatase MutT (NUDIX family)
MKADLQKKKVQVVVLAEGKLLRLKFNEKKSGYVNSFQNITGSVEGEESFEEGAERELQEEIGLLQKCIDLNFEFSFKDRWNNQVTEKVFLCFFDHIPAITLSDEHESYEWKNVTLVTPEDFLFPSNYQAFLLSQNYLADLKGKQ